MTKQVLLICCLNLISCFAIADNGIDIQTYIGRIHHLQTLQEAIYHEARGEPYKGQVVVGQVIINRVNHKRFPDTIKEVVEQPKQFSYTERKSLVMKEKRAKLKSFLIAIAITFDMVYYDQYKESLFYHACSGKHKVNPRWNWKKLTYDGKVGNHCFYSLRRENE